MADVYLKPVPRPAPESEPFWAAVRDHKLTLQRCGACGKFWFPPSRYCAHCLDGDHSWEEVSGTGRVFSFVTYQRLYHKGWEGELPYVVAVIALDEGPRILSALTGIDAADVKCDMAVKVVFEDITADATLPKFTPA